MTARELAALLLNCQHPDAEITTHANNHTAGRGDTIRVAYLKSCRIVIGNLTRRAINAPNEEVIYELDNGPRLPDNWHL